MLTILLTALHIVVSLILILVVLLQTGKRADLAGAFGGGGSQTVFGTRGAATFLSKLTTAAAVLFMLTSLGLSLVSARDMGESGSILPDEAPAESSAPAPAPTEGGTAPALPAEEPAGEGEGAEADETEPAPAE